MTIVTRAAVPIALVLAACSHRSAHPNASRPARSSEVVLTADDIEHAPGQSLEQLLLAHVPGLTMERAADGHLVLRLRGTNTLMGNEEPLFVINGIALGPNPNNLSAINTHDIDTVKVLRDAASTAQYGVRGTNGVIIIVTKH
ncbi:MAG TPA: TonB-dependent receptor plug domain-containing protein [Gemmatimonadales bacterium]|jgi:TonB-dependent SusC/RagA subfamily outer membrane receptor|nr:TonB-dependent receptor plug domain-containing protein [Gemmatimonadales bacterium]